MIDHRELCRFGLLGAEEAARFVLRGHFVYEGGGHGDTLLGLELLFADPRRLRRGAARLAEKLVQRDANLVCGPMIGGALVGQWIGCKLGVGFVFAESQPSLSGGGRRYAIPRELRGGVAGKRVIIVDDVINAGSATRACAREIESLGGVVVAVASLIVRESAMASLRQEFGVPIEALLAVDWNSWPASDCPLCRSGVALSPAP